MIDNIYSLYNLIYNLKIVELKILKIYIKTYLATSFIKSFKLPANILVLFICKKIANFDYLLIIKVSITNHQKLLSIFTN